ncbi:sensor histidine kinase [Carnobacterium mobile]|uniref:sensor histidine kinase n=1 Tax=Carnobacterium mobile TaxID=2750 RepID=UPI00186751A0|nr:sensor histidine kinase [Carnobacterium mobile]
MKQKVKSNQIYSLLKTYSIILILFLTVFSVAVGRLLYENNKKLALQSIQSASGRFEFLINKDQEKVEEVAVNLTSTPEKIDNIYQYFKLSYANYLSEVLDTNYHTDNYYYLPKVIESLYYNDSSLLATSINLTNYPEIYYSKTGSLMGEKVKQLPLTEAIRFSAILMNRNTLQPIGSLHMDFEKETFDQILTNQNTNYTIQTFVFSNTNQLTYQGSNHQSHSDIANKLVDQMAVHSKINLTELKKDYYVTESLTKSDHQIYTLIPRSEINVSTLKNTFSLFLFSLLIDSILLLILFHLFKKYVVQVEDILISIDQVAAGDSENRINTQDKKAETKQIAEGINDMLDSLQTYIKDIYELEIKQKDADMRALQSQINPHFLYNTLEYIRMSAISEGAEELADVVFHFATLLRNNISHEKIVTAENELKFCEKYIYLYQMRYPDQVAYLFKVCEDAKEVMIPKFAIQPLIENYFAHGIDFMKIENAISVKAYCEEGKTKIFIVDNGKGIPKEQMKQLNRSFKDTDLFKPGSVGIMNVYTRMKLYFGEQFEMEIKETVGGGTTIVMVF